eukprot:gnl/MRDRNA2_/MRDRNA2_147014_c0_seq1.p1 gnl/MRDRNA2_/MRDRNA2_147014_c0~~gnl/MRDRNA2_/MRDRNA2_147014_c0_seq1.p1  ORF type:complete len:377 (+),score=57.96 gnl/MRDRNA2_/MRDRNA2_147014_c0_seq1:123-1133(+)
MIVVSLLAKLQLFFADEPGCFSEIKTKSFFEQRCADSLARSALAGLKTQGAEQGDWSSLLHAFQNLIARGTVVWQFPHQTPRILVPNLKAQILWHPDDDAQLKAITQVVEQSFDLILADLEKLLTMSWAHDEEFVAYPFLISKGNWFKWSLFRNREWNETLCTVAKSTCSLLRSLLPSSYKRDEKEVYIPYVTGNDEEVIFFETSPGSQVAIHSGSTNTRLNIHMGLKDVEGSTMTIYGFPVGKNGSYSDIGGAQNFPWTIGKVGPIFDDSFDHAVNTPVTASRSRFVLAIGVLHPQLRNNPGLYADAFNQRTEITAWDADQHQIFKDMALEQRVV